MRVKELAVRFGGIPVAVIGGSLIIFSLYQLGDQPIEQLAAKEGTWDLILRAGFGVLLMGLLILFLFSIRTVPREISTSFLNIQGRNIGRTVKAMNLHGKGVYFPPVGRLRDDRVYIPFERQDLPIPELSDETVFNVGSTGPSMGLSLIPPGKGFVDTVEEQTGSKFMEEDLRDGSEALEKLSKGTGMFRSIELRDRKDSVELKIIHDRKDHVCSSIWGEFDTLHSQVGCPLCSAVLVATCRMASKPLRITSVRINDGQVTYELEKVIR